MIPGFLFDVLALPRYLASVLPWWTAFVGLAGLMFIAGGLRAAARLLLFLTAITIGTFLAASAWLADHPDLTAGVTEAADTEGGDR